MIFDQKTGSPRRVFATIPPVPTALRLSEKREKIWVSICFYNPLISTTSPPAWVPIAYQLM